MEFSNIISILESKMINRSPSGTIRSKATIENVTAALNQKDKMVELLKRELEGFKNLRQDYDRLRDRKTFLLDKCDTINREIVHSTHKIDFESREPK